MAARKTSTSKNAPAKKSAARRGQILPKETAGRVLDMFVAGATYRQIADRLDLTEAAVEKAVRAEIVGGAKRRDLLVDEAGALHVERTESLFRAHYPLALRGDHRSAQICLGSMASSPPSTNSETSIQTSLQDGEAPALEALRDRLAAEIDNCTSPRLLAALSRQFVTVIDQLNALRPNKPTTKRDQLAKKRAERQAAAAVAAAAAGVR